MRISNVFLKNVDSYNDFTETENWYVQEGQENVLYLRIVDLDRDGLRFIPDAGSEVEVTFTNIEDGEPDIVKTASIEYEPEDRSIFKLTLDNDEIPASGNVKFKLTHNTKEYYWMKTGGVTVQTLEVGGCGC